MSAPTEFPVISSPLRRDEAGGIRIGQSRVTLDSLLASYHKGATPEEISVQYPVLSLAEIYGAITYYLTHKSQIDSYLEERHQQAQQRRQDLDQRHNLSDLRKRLLSRSESQRS